MEGSFIVCKLIDSNVRIADGYLFLIKRQAQDRYLWVVLTDMAQGQRAGLITQRT